MRAKPALRIKSFFGRSVNAVKTQVWIALSAYVLVAIIKKELNIDRSLGQMLQILSVSAFEKMPLLQAFSLKYETQDVYGDSNQLSLFNI